MDRDHGLSSGDIRRRTAACWTSSTWSAGRRIVSGPATVGPMGEAPRRGPDETEAEELATRLAIRVSEIAAAAQRDKAIAAWFARR